jgi:hypothetical protein
LLFPIQKLRIIVIILRVLLNDGMYANDGWVHGVSGILRFAFHGLVSLSLSPTCPSVSGGLSKVYIS